MTKGEKQKFKMMKARYILAQCDDNSDKNEALPQGCEQFLQNPNCNNCINLQPNKENLTYEKMFALSLA